MCFIQVAFELYHISNDSDLSDERTIENIFTEISCCMRRFYLESLPCDVSFLRPENSRPFTPDMKKYMIPVKRISHLSKYLNTPTPPKNKVSSGMSRFSGRVLTSAKSIELMEEN